jgi:hypothetical protein
MAISIDEDAGHILCMRTQTEIAASQPLTSQRHIISGAMFPDTFPMSLAWCRREGRRRQTTARE